jgi:uncharacterized iron-regulated protein
MRTLFRSMPLLLLAACGGHSGPAVTPAAFALPDSTYIVDAATGAPVAPAELQRRAATANLVLLGEVHDNAVQHALRGALLTSLAAHHPAVVFEQFAETEAPIPPPAAGGDLNAWLDSHGFDRKNWSWPLHQPIVEAALAHGRSLWGSGVSREALRAVVRGGEAAAPSHLRPLIEQAPLDSAARAAIDFELMEGHCGKLPVTMIPGMRGAQVVRDAAMTHAMLLAGANGPVWLIAGNGHVRRDVGVPRMLHVAAPAQRTLVVGLLERGEDGAAPTAAERSVYDLVIVTPRAAREDPCASL